MKYIKSYKLFESRSWNIKTDLIDQLDDFEIEKHYNKYYKESGNHDIRELIEALVDLWRYVNDDKFIKDYINTEANRLANDWYYEFKNKYDKEKYLIPYIIKIMKPKDENYIRNKYIDEQLDKDDENFEDQKNEDIEIILDNFENSDLKEIIENISSSFDFCYEYSEKIYQHYSTAYEILNELYSSEELDDYYNFFKKNIFDIQKYLNQDKMCEDYDKYFTSIEYMTGMLEDFIDRDLELQKKIFEKDPEKNSVVFVEEDILLPELGKTYKFQKSYIEESIEIETEDNGEISDKPQFVFDLLKDNFIDKEMPIDQKIIKEYNIEDLAEGNEFGFFNLR